MTIKQIGPLKFTIDKYGDLLSKLTTPTFQILPFIHYPKYHEKQKIEVIKRALI